MSNRREPVLPIQATITFVYLISVVRCLPRYLLRELVEFPKSFLKSTAISYTIAKQT